MSWIALLRGINVGGANRVPMADLREMFHSLGFPGVQTHIQSGNVVVPGELPADAEARLEKGFAERFGFRVEFVVRSKSELEEAISNNPFPEQASSDPSHLLITFFKRPLAPNEEAWGQVDELVQVVGREAFAYFPSGIGNSKLKFPISGTARNWNTILKLSAMAQLQQL